MIQDYWIEQQVPAEFAPLIPLRYAKGIEAGDFLAVGAYDSWDDEPVGVIVFREQEGWMELVWLHISDAYRESEDALRFVQRRLEATEKAGMLNGAFIDFADEQEEEPMAWLLQTLGFRKDIVSNQVYELTLADVKDTEALHRQPSKNVRSLHTINEEFRRKLVKAVLVDERPVPLATPVDWSAFDENISVVYMNETEPQGMLLFECREKDLIFSCAWASDPKDLVSMLVVALQQAEQRLTEDTAILIPVLSDRVAGIVEKLVPTATCRSIHEWSLGFTNHGDGGWVPLEQPEP